MDELPLLMMPIPGETGERAKRTGGGGQVRGPGTEGQVKRLSPAWKELHESFERRRNQLRSDVTGLEPEEVIVLECLGTVGEFINAAKHVAGLEWLGEWDAGLVDPDDGFYQLKPKKGEPPREDRTSPIPKKLFLVFANQQALGQMLSMWGAWSRGEKLARGLGRWEAVFEQLRQVRRWNIEDRLAETGLMEDWQARAAQGQEVGIAEVELWFRSDPARRALAEQSVSSRVREEGGDVITRTCIEGASYHALLVRMPLDSMLSVQGLDHIAFLQSEDIQFARPAGQCSELSPEGEPEALSVDTVRLLPSGAPVAALLDGLPMQNHPILRDRVIIDDPDGFESEYPVHARIHGTAMASLIVAGDLSGSRVPIRTMLYVRPIMMPKDNLFGTEENVPEIMLFPDLIHRAVRRMKEGEAGVDATAPEVTVVNLSVADRTRPFFGTMSATARVLDWLSWRYGVLFLVSAGNCSSSIQIEAPEGRPTNLDSAELEDRILRARFDDRRNRRLLSPAESVNAISVGAVHDDLYTGDPQSPNWHDPCSSTRQPSVLNPISGGYNRSLKPDILLPGGRQLLKEDLLSNGELVTLDLVRSIGPPGILTAAPPAKGQQVPGAQAYSRGTSNATALATREAIQILDVLQWLRREPGSDVLEEIPWGLWLKTLLIHGADWGELPTIPRRALGDERLRSGKSDREALGRLLGYGAYSPERSRVCTPWRATALGSGRLEAEQSHVHKVPIPRDFGALGKRRLTVTLAWFTPVRPEVLQYAVADLWCETRSLDSLGLNRKQANNNAAQRGTAQHEVFEGEKTAITYSNQDLEIQVNCRATGGRISEPVPYGLAVTLEVAEGLSIYQEIRERLHQRVAVRSARI